MQYKENINKYVFYEYGVKHVKIKIKKGKCSPVKFCPPSPLYLALTRTQNKPDNLEKRTRQERGQDEKERERERERERTRKKDLEYFFLSTQQRVSK